MEIVIDKKGKIGQLTSTTQPVDAGKSCSPLAKMSENEEIYTAGKNFTLPPAVTGVTNIISAVTKTKYIF